MSKLSYYERDYAARLEKYIASEAASAALYRDLAGRLGGKYAGTLKTMSMEENAHLRALQLEYYLLTGDSFPCPAELFDGDCTRLLRMAYAGELEAARGYEEESALHVDKALAEAYMARSADELRHRANVKAILSDIMGFGNPVTAARR